MFERYVKCPVCKRKTRISVPDNAVAKNNRFPVMLRIKHREHHFYISLDSRALIMDILSPERVE